MADIDFSKFKTVKNKEESPKEAPAKSWWERTKEASIKKAKEDKDKPFTDYLGDSAKNVGKSVVAPAVRASTYGQNIFATGEDVLGGRYFGTEIPSLLNKAEARRTKASEVEEKAYNLFDFSPREKTIAKMTTDLWASVATWGVAAKSSGAVAKFLSAPKTVLWGIGKGAVTGAVGQVPYSVLSEGRLPTAGELTTSAVVGGSVGSVLGAIPKITKYGKSVTGGMEEAKKVGESQIVGGVNAMRKSITRDVMNTGKVDEVAIVKESTQKLREALRPSVSWVDSNVKVEMQDKKLLQGVRHIIDNGQSKLAKKGMKGSLEAAQNTKQSLWAKLEANNGKVDTLTNGSDLSSSLRKELTNKDNSALFRANPKAKEVLLSYIDDIEKNPQWKNLSQKDLQETLTSINEGLPASSFAKQMDANPAETIKNTLIAKALRSRIDDNLEEAIGMASKEDRLAYGAVRQLEKDLAKRYAVYARQNPAWIVDMIGMDALPEILAGIVTGNTWRVVRGVGVAVTKGLIKSQNNPDKIIRDVFKLQEKVKPKTIKKP